MTKTSVAKEIQKMTFTNSSKNDTNLFVTNRQLQNIIVAMEINPREKFFVFFHELVVCSFDQGGRGGE